MLYAIAKEATVEAIRRSPEHVTSMVRVDPAIADFVVHFEVN